MVAAGCSSSDQGAIDKAVSATLAAAQPATPTATRTPVPTDTPAPEATAVPTSVPTPTLKPTVVPTPTPKPADISIPTLEPTVTDVRGPEPTAIPTENEIVTVTTNTSLIGIEGSQITLEGVQAKTLSGVGVLEAWARWDSEGEWEEASINQETGLVSGSHIYSRAGEYTASVWVQGETGDKGWVYIVVNVLPAPTPTPTATPVPALTTGVDFMGDEGVCLTKSDGSINCIYSNREVNPVSGLTANRPVTAWYPNSDYSSRSCYAIGSSSQFLGGEVYCDGKKIPNLYGSEITGLIGSFASGCALKSDGTVWCWGDNNSGQIGNDTVGFGSEVPVQVSWLKTVVQLVGSEQLHRCALDVDGDVSCWGSNIRGQLGWDEELEYSSQPGLVHFAGPSGGKEIKHIAANSWHSCAVLADSEGGAVMCWGSGGLHLGDGEAEDRRAPVFVLGMNNVSSVHLASSHSCALTKIGEIRCWGQNGKGVFGDGTTQNSGNYKVRTSIANLPAAVKFFTTDRNASCAVLENDELWCWGDLVSKGLIKLQPFQPYDESSYTLTPILIREQS